MTDSVVSCPFQHISGHIRMVPACNFIVLSRWNTTLQTQSYDILPGHIIINQTKWYKTRMDSIAQQYTYPTLH